jgi:protein-S-isoprenylcysteine O-methyltransferase Ste14
MTPAGSPSPGEMAIARTDLARPFVVANWPSVLRHSAGEIWPSLAARDLTKAVVLDFGERIAVMLVFLSFASRILAELLISINVASVFLFISEIFPVALILCRRRASTYSDRPADWLLGFCGACIPLLIEQAEAGTAVPQSACILLMTVGLFTQVSGKVILGRSFGIVAANRGVKVSGPYRFVRHPIYAGYTITHIGFLLACPSALNSVIYATMLAIQIARILREERVLGQDPAYRDYAASVRYRLCPMIF